MPDVIVLDPKYAERFWSRVTKSETCWIYTCPKGQRWPDTYPSMAYALNTIAAAHRISWMIHYGPIPDGLNVCHHCDVKRCVRPDHLFLGTDSDNIMDFYRKYRERRALARLW